jgi:hypothetical protein
MDMRLMGIVIAMVLGASVAASAAPQPPEDGMSPDGGMSVWSVAARSGAGSGATAEEACDAAINSLSTICGSISNVSGCSCQQTSTGFNCQVSAECN